MSNSPLYIQNDKIPDHIKESTLFQNLEKV